jgi:hypothetical protein
VAVELNPSLAQRAPRWSLPDRPAQPAAPRRRPALGAAWLPALAIPFLFLLFASVGPLVDQAVGSFFNWYDIHPGSFAGFHYYSDGASKARIATRLFLPMAASTLVVVVVLTVLQVWNESLIMIVMTNSPSLYTLPVLVAAGLGGTAALGASWLTIGPPLLLSLASQRYFLRGIAPGPLL